MVDFLMVHYGRRISDHAMRAELRRAAAEAGLDGATPHQLRHTYATALVNAGVSLQHLMVLLRPPDQPKCALRYGRLFDATVRESYERALVLAKSRLGPLLPPSRPRPAQHRLALGTAHQGPSRGWLLLADRRPGLVRLREYLRVLPELPQRRRVPGSHWRSARPMPTRWPPTRKQEVGAKKPHGTAASSSASTCSWHEPRPGDRRAAGPSGKGLH